MPWLTHRQRDRLLKSAAVCIRRFKSGDVMAEHRAFINAVDPYDLARFVEAQEDD